MAPWHAIYLIPVENFSTNEYQFRIIPPLDIKYVRRERNLKLSERALQIIMKLKTAVICEIAEYIEFFEIL